MKKINWKNTIIRGEVKSDDCVKQAIFNAIPWFEQAADDDICALAACDFGGDYPADDVARFISGDDESVASVLDYCTCVDGIGFECHLDTFYAQKWIEDNRPDLQIEF